MIKLSDLSQGQQLMLIRIHGVQLMREALVGGERWVWRTPSGTLPRTANPDELAVVQRLRVLGLVGDLVESGQVVVTNAGDALVQERLRLESRASDAPCALRNRVLSALSWTQGAVKLLDREREPGEEHVLAALLIAEAALSEARAGI